MNNVLDSSEAISRMYKAENDSLSLEIGQSKLSKPKKTRKNGKQKRNRTFVKLETIIKGVLNAQWESKKEKKGSKKYLK